jgi:two-component system KDP operon response regulator KdpE
MALPGPGVSAVSTTTAPRVVIVDEDQSRARDVALLLAGCGINVECVATPDDADDAVARYCPDMIMMRLESPPHDEWGATRLDRSPSASRPFSASGFVARLRIAADRVATVAAAPRIESEGLSIDFDRRRIRVGPNEIRVSPKEFELLDYLASYPDAVVPHRAILTALWGRQAIHHPERLWALVTKVRRKIEPDTNTPRFLLSEPWVGYRLALDRRP